jgi:hypothetical protein
LAAKFVDVIAAHLIHDEEDDEFRALRRFGRSRGLGGLGNDGGREIWCNATKHKKEH